MKQLSACVCLVEGYLAGLRNLNKLSDNLSCSCNGLSSANGVCSFHSCTAQFCLSSTPCAAPARNRACSGTALSLEMLNDVPVTSTRYNKHCGKEALESEIQQRFVHLLSLFSELRDYFPIRLLQIKEWDPAAYFEVWYNWKWFKGIVIYPAVVKSVLRAHFPR